MPHRTNLDARELRRLPRSVFTPAEAKRILESAKSTSTLGQRDRTSLEVLYATGIRSAELRHLKAADVDLAQGLLRVNLGKCGVDRVVPLGAVACRFLETYLAGIRPVLLGAAPGKPSERLFLRANGNPVDAPTLGGDGVSVDGMIGNGSEIRREICQGGASAATVVTSLATDKGVRAEAKVGTAGSSVDLWDTITHRERSGSACIQATKRREGSGDGSA